jgi:hypothetical protein
MIYHLRFTGAVRCFGKLIIIAQHIYQGRFAHVASANEGVFIPVWCRALLKIRAADEVLRFFYVHEFARYKDEGRRGKIQGQGTRYKGK